MTDSTLEIHKAIVAKLLADSAVTALVGTRIYDRVPQSPVYPHIEIAESYGEPWEAQDMDGWHCVQSIKCWSRKVGSVEAKQIAAAVKASLHRQVLTLDTQNFVLCNHLSSNQISYDDTLTTQVLLRFEFLTH